MEIACCISADGADDEASGNADAVLIAKKAVRNLSSWRERPAKPMRGRLDFGSVTIGCLLPALAHPKDQARGRTQPLRYEVSKRGRSCAAPGATTSMRTIRP